MVTKYNIVWQGRTGVKFVRLEDGVWRQTNHSPRRTTKVLSVDYQNGTTLLRELQIAHCERDFVLVPETA